MTLKKLKNPSMPLLDKKDVLRIVILSVALIVGLLLLSDSTSPLYPHSLGVDSSIFSLLGKGLINGKDLYTDLFDHKGPVIFFINAVGHLLGGRIGIFLMQCLSGILYTSILYLIYKTVRADDVKNKFWDMLFLTVAGLGYFFYTFEGGNLTEEYSLPLIALSLYLFVRYTSRAEETADHPPLFAFLYGICFTILAFIRLNNAITIGAGVLFIIGHLVYRKRYKNILVNIVFGLLGVLAVALPLFLYFGIHSSLNEMIYATFLHNFQIFEETGHFSIFSNIKLYAKLFFPFACCLVLVIVHLCRRRTITAMDVLLLSVFFANILVLFIANRFPHYFLIFAPVYCLFLYRYVYYTKKDVASLLDVLCVLIHVYSLIGDMRSNIKVNYLDDELSTRHHTVMADMARIPADERDRVIGYEIEASDYLRGDIIPCYRYYTLQETWGVTEPQIVLDLMEWAETERPTWILTKPDMKNEDLLDILEKDYELQFENAYLRFYRVISSD